MKILLSCIVAATGPCTSAVAQGVTLSATTRTEHRVIANGLMHRIAANSDVSSGFRISVADDNVPTGSASASMAVTTDPDVIRIDLQEGAGGGFDFPGRQGGGAFGPQTLAVVLRSPVAIRASLRVQWCASWSGTSGRYTAQLDVGGHGTVSSPTRSDSLCVFGFAHERTFPVVVGPAGVSLTYRTEGSAIGSLRGGNGYSSGRWRIELTPAPDDPCGVVGYGADCGASLTAGPDLRFPGLLVVRLTDASRPALGFLIAGVQRTSLPLGGGCLLYNEGLVVAPWSVDAAGVAVVHLDPPPIPGLRVTVQGATVGSALHATGGIEITCR